MPRPIPLSLVAVCLLLLGTPGFADDDPPPLVALRSAAVDGAAVVEAVLPGRVVATTPWPGGGLAVLVAVESEPAADGSSADDDSDDDKRPRALYRLTTQAQASELEPLTEDLPVDLDALATVGDTLLVGASDPATGGRIWTWTASGLEPLFDHPALRLGHLGRHGLIDGDGLALPEVGRLTRIDLADGSVRDQTPVPATARRCSTGFELSSPPIERFAEGRYVAGPVAAGSQRARTLLIDPSAATEEDRVIEMWSRLPSPEDIDDHRYVTIDERPFLIAITTDAERLGVFEKSKLRVLPLGGDRTRAGRGATFQLETDTRNWYSVGVEVYDATGDGRDDLLVLQPQGLSGGDLVVELFPGLGNGRFGRRSRKTELDDVEGARWLAGRDWTADGLADLWVVAEGQLRLFAGVDHKRRTLDKKPIRTLDATVTANAARTVVEHPGHPDAPSRLSYRGRPRLDDLDGDGRPEITLVRHVRGRGLVRIVSPG